MKKVRRAEKIHSLRQRTLDTALAQRAHAEREAEAARARARAAEARADEAAARVDEIASTLDLEHRSAYCQALARRAENEWARAADLAAAAQHATQVAVAAHQAERIADTLASNARKEAGRHEARLERRVADERAARAHRSDR